MHAAHDNFLTLRLPASLRRDLDAAAQAKGVGLSAATRTALAMGLRALRASSEHEPPRPSGPAASMAAAA